jgi:hypothetical protein
MSFESGARPGSGGLFQHLGSAKAAGWPFRRGRIVQSEILRESLAYAALTLRTEGCRNLSEQILSGDPPRDEGRRRIAD